MGRKLFGSREVLASTDVQDYLMDQTVMRFPSAAVRDVEIPTAQATEGMICTLDDTDELLRWGGTRWRRLRGNPQLVAFSESMGAGSSVAPGGTGFAITAGATVPAHTAGTLHISGHVMLAGSNTCAGYVQLGIGSTTSTLAVIGARARYHNNGTSSLWTVPVDAYYDSDGSARVVAYLGWSDPASNGTITAAAASVRANLL